MAVVGAVTASLVAISDAALVGGMVVASCGRGLTWSFRICAGSVSASDPALVASGVWDPVGVAVFVSASASGSASALVDGALFPAEVGVPAVVLECDSWHQNRW